MSTVNMMTVGYVFFFFKNDAGMVEDEKVNRRCGKVK